MIAKNALKHGSDVFTEVESGRERERQHLDGGGRGGHFLGLFIDVAEREGGSCGKILPAKSDPSRGKQVPSPKACRLDSSCPVERRAGGRSAQNRVKVQESKTRGGQRGRPPLEEAG